MGVVNGVVVPLLEQRAYVRDCMGYVGAMETRRIDGFVMKTHLFQGE